MKLMNKSDKLSKQLTKKIDNNHRGETGTHNSEPDGYRDGDPPSPGEERRTVAQRRRPATDANDDARAIAGKQAPVCDSREATSSGSGVSSIGLANDCSKNGAHVNYA